MVVPGLVKGLSGEETARDGVLQGVWEERRRAVSLLPVVRRASTPQARRVLHGSPTRPRQGLARVALPRWRPARPLQRLGRPWPRRGRRLRDRERGGAAIALPSPAPAE